MRPLVELALEKSSRRSHLDSFRGGRHRITAVLLQSEDWIDHDILLVIFNYRQDQLEYSQTSKCSIPYTGLSLARTDCLDCFTFLTLSAS
jgi:hypothetical protein